MLNKLVVAICSVTVITGCSVQPIRFATEELRETVRSDMDRLTRHQDEISGAISLDEAIARAVRNNRDRALLLVLLPLTSPHGGEGYLARINQLLHEHFGIDSSFESLGVRVTPFNLEPGHDRNGLRNFLYNECGLNDQQVAV